MVLAMSMGGVKADPATDALARLNELSRQAVKSREAVTAAQRDVDARLAAQTAAEDRHRADLEALEAANTQLQSYQAAVNRVAAMTYMSGRTGKFAAVLTAASPQQLIDQLSLQRKVAAETADQIKAFQSRVSAGPPPPWPRRDRPPTPAPRPSRPPRCEQTCRRS